MPINETATGDDSVAITGTASQGERTIGVIGQGDAVGIRGLGKGWHGVEGISQSTIGGIGVYGKNSAGGTGIVGESSGWMGVYGKSQSTSGGAGVMGEGDPGPGVVGKSTKWIGVYGETAGVENGPAGVWGEHKGAGVGIKAVSKDGAGLAAYSTTGEAVHAETNSPLTAAIAAYNLAAHGTGSAIYAKKEGDVGHAGFFDGNVHITRNLTIQGIDVVTYLQQLQQRIADLETLARGTIPQLARISVELAVRPQDGVATFAITGEGFRPNVHVNLLVFGKTSAPNVTETDNMGKFSVNVQIACVAGETLSISAFDPNHPDGRQVSNTFTITCS